MTVAEMSPIELYSIIMTAIVVAGLGYLGLREWPRLTTNGERFMWFGGVFALFGLPCIIAFTTAL